MLKIYELNYFTGCSIPSGIIQFETILHEKWFCYQVYLSHIFRF